MNCRSLAQISDSLLSTVDTRRQQGGVDLFGIATGFHTIDQWTGGLQPDNYWVIGARSSLGKSSLGLGIAQHVATAGSGVLLYSYEMSGELLLSRLLAMETGIPVGRLLRGKFFGEDEWKRVQQTTTKLRSIPLSIIDSTPTIEELGAHAHKVAKHARTPLGLVIVDYLTLVQTEKRGSEYERVTHVTQQLRYLARPDQLNIPVIALAQINRQAEAEEDKRPQLHQLRSSGQIEQDADVVLLLHRPSHYERMRGGPDKDVEDDAEIIVGKNRSGPAGMTKAKFYPRTTKWEQPAPVVKGEPKPVTTLKDRVQKGRKAA